MRRLEGGVSFNMPIKFKSSRDLRAALQGGMTDRDKLPFEDGAGNANASVDFVSSNLAVISYLPSCIFHL